MANSQSETLVKGILEGVVKDYEMKFMRAEKDLDEVETKIEISKSTSDSATTSE